MSLFIGRDTQGKSIIHITSTPHSVDEMKNGIQPDSVLHNDLVFFGFDLYPVVLKSGYWKYAHSSLGNYIWYIEDASVTKAMVNAKLSYFLTSSMQVIDPFNAYATGLTYYPSNNMVVPDSISRTQSYTYHIPMLHRNNALPPKPDVAYILIANDRKLINTSGCYIKGTTNGPLVFRVGDLDIGQIKYISEGRINNSPDCPVIDGYHQLINTPAINGGLTLSSNAVTGTTIKKGGHVIIDGSYSSLGGETIVHTYSVPVNNNGTFYVMTANLHDTQRVETNGGVRFFTIDGTNSSTLIYTYTAYFFEPGLNTYLPVSTNVYYKIQNTSVFLHTVNTHAYSSQYPIPSPFSVKMTTYR